jgi:hypothetical protein
MTRSKDVGSCKKSQKEESTVLRRGYEGLGKERLRGKLGSDKPMEGLQCGWERWRESLGGNGWAKVER